MKKPKGERKRIYFEMKRLKIIRDELLSEENYGRREYLLFRLGAVHYESGGWNRSSCELSGGWEFRGDTVNDLAKQIYSFRISRILKGQCA